MANKVQLKSVGDQEFGENDPFAEITRIMGFDPRVQLTPRQENDLDVDLEKELMGEFGERLPDDQPAASKEALAPVPPQPIPSDEEFVPVSSAPVSEIDDLEQALSAVFDDAAPQGNHVPARSPSLDPAPELTEAAAARPQSGTPASEPEMAPGEDILASEFEEAFSRAAPVQDKGPELARSLNAMLDQAGYKTGSSFSGTAQVYQMVGAYAPASDEKPEEAGAISDQADSPAATGETPAHRATVFGTPAPEWQEAAAVPETDFVSEDTASDHEADYFDQALSAVDEPTDRLTTEAPVGDAQHIEDPAPASAEEEDPFAVLASLGSEQTAERPQPAPLPAAPQQKTAATSATVNQPYRRFEGAARFYSSPAIFSRATPVAPGMRQPVVPAPAVPHHDAPENSVDTPVEQSKPTPIMPAEEPVRSEAAEALAREIEVPVDEILAAFDEAAPQGAAVVSATPSMEAAPRPIAEPQPVQSKVEPSVPAKQMPEPTPDIETIDVPEPAVALTDDLDIPAPPVVEDVPPAPAFDELDHEFVDAFASIQKEEQNANGQHLSSQEDDELSAKIEEMFAAEDFSLSDHEPETQYAKPAAAAGGSTATSRWDAESQGTKGEAYALQDDYYDAAAAAAYGDGMEEAVEYPPMRALAVRDRRGPIIAAVMGCVVIVGAIGAYAFSHHGLKVGGPVLLKADAQPVKRKPAHPGGMNVPNQDNQVYNRVADGDVPAPVRQQKLVSSEEQPIDVNAHVQQQGAAPDSASQLPGVDTPKIPQASSGEIAALAQNGADAADDDQKGQARLAPSPRTGDDRSQSDDVIAVTPRKVHTMIVRPDGSMVPNAMPAPAAPAPKTVAEAALEEPAAKAPAGTPAQAPRKPAAGERQVATPQHVAVAPSRPAEQPMSTPTKAGNEKVAALEAKPAQPEPAAAASGWAMQIASQPTAQAAQTSYQNLARRYGSVLGGHGVDIVKAEVSGKGTYYRVRVPAQSREAAIDLCTKYRAAGGSCFVSR